MLAVDKFLMTFVCTWALRGDKLQRTASEWGNAWNSDLFWLPTGLAKDSRLRSATLSVEGRSYEFTEALLLEIKSHASEFPSVLTLLVGVSAPLASGEENADLILRRYGADIGSWLFFHSWPVLGLRDLDCNKMFEFGGSGGDNTSESSFFMSALLYKYLIQLN